MLTIFDLFKKPNDNIFAYTAVLEEGYFIDDSQEYFHILHKISNQYYQDKDIKRLMEDVDSWIEETFCKETREGLIELRNRLLDV